MIEKTISYTDFRGNKVEDTFAFNLSGSEIAKLAMTRKGLDEYLRSIIEAENVQELFVMFEELLGMAVGELVNDRVFDKNAEITAKFMRSGAYDEFFFELIGDASFAAEFLKSIFPANLEERVDKILKGQEEKKEYTDAELIAMPQHEFEAVAGKDPKNWDQRHLQIAYMRKTAA